jgi:hypothetical protein
MTLTLRDEIKLHLRYFRDTEQTEDDEDMTVEDIINSIKKLLK